MESNLAGTLNSFVCVCTHVSVCVLFCFPPMIILLLNHRKRQYLSQWSVEAMVAWTQVLSLSVQKYACTEYEVFIDKRLHFRLYFTFDWEIGSLLWLKKKSSSTSK